MAATISNIDKDTLAAALAEAMTKPVFAAAFVESNPGLASFVKSSMDGDATANKLANMDALLDTNMGDMLNNPELTAATLLQVLDDLSPEEIAGIVTSIDQGITAAEAAGTVTANVTDNLKNAIMQQSTVPDKTKVTLALQMSIKPEFVNNCAKTALMSVNPDLVKAAMAAILSCDPNLLNAVSTQEALAAISLSPDASKGGMLNTLDSPEARRVLLTLLASNNMIDAPAAADLVDKVGADPSNASDSCVTAVTGAVANGRPATVADVANIMNCDPPAAVPETTKANFSTALDALSDQQLTALMTQCMNDPSFAEAFKTNNPAIQESITNAEEVLAQGTKPEDLLAGKEFTDEEKMQILLNTLDNADFAKSISEIALQIKDDPEATASSIDAIKTAIFASPDTASHDE